MNRQSDEEIQRAEWKWKLLSRVRLFATPWNSPGQNTGVGIPFSGGSSQPRDQTQVSNIAGRFFTSWATREAHIKQRKLKKEISYQDKRKIKMSLKKKSKFNTLWQILTAY